MAYDELLANRIRNIFTGRKDVSERKMFGGLCIMIGGHMCCGIVGNVLMARVGPDHYENALKQPNVRLMDFTGKPMRGMIYVNPPGIKTDTQLQKWVTICEAFVFSLPPK